MKQRPELKAFKNLLNDYNYYKKVTKELKEEIEECYYRLSGLHSADASRMPVHSPPNKESEYRLRNRIEYLSQKQARAQSKVEEVDEILDRIKTPEKKAIIDVYVYGRTGVDVAREFNLSPTALFYRMNRVLKKALSE